MSKHQDIKINKKSESVKTLHRTRTVLWSVKMLHKRQNTHLETAKSGKNGLNTL